MNATVVIPAFNCEETIESTLRSVDESIRYCNSRLPEFNCEIVVVVDKALDETESVAREFAGNRDDCRILNNQTNMGAGFSRNIGVRNARGELIFFLDGDDIYFPEHIHTCVSCIKAYPDLHWVETKIHIDEEIHPDWRPLIEASVPFNICVRRWVHDFIGGFPDTDIFRVWRCEDIFYRRILREFCIGKKIQKVTMQHFRYPGNALDRQMKKFRASPDSEVTSLTDAEKQVKPQIKAYQHERKKAISTHLAKWMRFLVKHHEA